MNLSYSISIAPNSLRTIHTILIDGEQLSTTRAKAILIFAKPHIFDKLVWKELKEAVRLGQPLEVKGGGLFY